MHYLSHLKQVFDKLALVQKLYELLVWDLIKVLSILRELSRTVPWD